MTLKPDYLVVMNNACLNVWGATELRPACNYIAGHYCGRNRGHPGRCTCECGATTRLKPGRAEAKTDVTDPLLDSVRLAHGRDTCDEAGRPLSTYVCEYHQGFRDGLDDLAEQLGLVRALCEDEIAKTEAALAVSHADNYTAVLGVAAHTFRRVLAVLDRRKGEPT